MTDTVTSAGIFAVVALVTVCTRALPFLLFRDQSKAPKIVSQLGGVLPYAMMGLLVVYCLKSVSVRSYPFGLPELIAGAVVVLLHRWKHRTLLSVGGGTVLYMLLVQFIFV